MLVVKSGNRPGLRVTFGVEVLGDRSLGAAVLAIDDVAEAGRALAARPVVQLVDEAARLCGGARRRDGANHRASLYRFREDAEAGAAEGLAHIDRKSVVSGQSVSVRLDLGGRHIHKK